MAMTVTRPSAATTSLRPDTFEMARVVIGEVGFALPLAAIATILPLTALAWRENGGVWAGDLAVRGGSIPVADGRVVFGFDRATTSGRQALILRGNPATGLLVDGVVGTATVPAGAVEWLSPLFGSPERLLTQAIVGASDGRLDLAIDLPALRRFLHAGEDSVSSTLTAPIEEVFESLPPGEQIEARLDASNRRWLLPVSCVRHISEPRAPAPLPRAGAAILGILAWRRRPIPLVDTTIALDLPPAEPGAIVVIGPPARPGLPIDDALLALSLNAIFGVAPPDTTAEQLDLANLIRRLAG
jgi:chemotaxis signal transduction protein